MEDPISAYRHWKGFSANESNFRRLHRYYEAQATDRCKINFRFRNTGVIIQILVHRRAPKQEFQALLHRFFRVHRSESEVSNEDIEIRVTDRGGESHSSDSGASSNMHPDYKVLDANETHVEHLCRVYDARAEDQSWMFYKFRPASLSVYIIVQKRVPLQEFKSLLEEFLQQQPKKDVVRDENVEIRVCDRGDQSDLGDRQVEDSEDLADRVAGIDDE